MKAPAGFGLKVEFGLLLAAQLAGVVWMIASPFI